MIHILKIILGLGKNISNHIAKPRKQQNFKKKFHKVDRQRRRGRIFVMH